MGRSAWCAQCYGLTCTWVCATRERGYPRLLLISRHEAVMQCSLQSHAKWGLQVRLSAPAARAGVLPAHLPRAVRRGVRHVCAGRGRARVLAARVRHRHVHRVPAGGDDAGAGGVQWAHAGRGVSHGPVAVRAMHTKCLCLVTSKGTGHQQKLAASVCVKLHLVSFMHGLVTGMLSAVFLLV